MMSYPNPYLVQAKRDELLQKAEHERLVNQVTQTEHFVSFRRAVEMLVGAIQATEPAKRQPEVVEPMPHPKFATDSGIHRIR
jgi:hypothetical protein